jgi:hypothetical protein
MDNRPLPEFRFYYFTASYGKTVAFYRDYHWYELAVRKGIKILRPVSDSTWASFF